MTPASQPLVVSVKQIVRSPRSRLLRGLAVSLGIFGALWSGVEGQPASAQRAAADENRHYDRRLEAAQGFSVQPLAAQTRSVNAYTSLIPDLMVTYDDKFGVTRSLMNAVGYLTLEAPGIEAFDIGVAFVESNAELLGLQPEDLAGYKIAKHFRNPVTGSTHLYLRQTYQGLEVYNAELQVNVNRAGRIMGVNNQFVPRLGASINAVSPGISAAQAVASAAAHAGLAVNGLPRTLSTSFGLDRETAIDHEGLALEPIQAKLMYLPVRLGDVRLVWNFNLYQLDAQHWYDFTVDADTGAVWTRFDWVASDTYTIFQRPLESPNHSATPPPGDGRSVVVDPHDAAAASPFGWHDTNGVGGSPEYTITRGNNVHAYDDINANNVPDGTVVECGPTILCNFAIAFAGPPSGYIGASISNLFYWNNIIHDVQYRYGFTESGGNFQFNNYGRGGVGNDDVMAEGQDGGGTNNANFATPSDGSRPRMQMYNWTTATPNKDGDLDAGIVVHEYGHGISNRQVGSSVSCLTNAQQPGEGISDWLSLVYTGRTGDTGPMGRGIGTFALNQPITGLGIRGQRYSTDPAVNTWTYASIAGMAIPHGVGSVFAQGNWEVYWALVNQYGFSTDIYNSVGGFGNQRAMLYFNQSLQNSICNPAFTDVRDAFIQATIDNYGGADTCRAWAAFAGFGLGLNAVSGGPNSTTPTNGFGLPGSCIPGGAPVISINDVSVNESQSSVTFTASINPAPAPGFPASVNFTTADGTAVYSTNDVSTTNAAAITINDATPSGTPMPATPYPFAVTVASSPGPVTKVTARLNGFSHTWPDDVDVLLVGPTGASVVLMSDAGGGNSVSNLNLTFSDTGGPMPGVLVSGAYMPTNVAQGSDVYAAPAPAGPYGSTMSVFNGLNPIGAWNVYVMDDFPGDVGSISGGVTITIGTPSGDYLFSSGMVNFAPGVTSQPVTITLYDDMLVEGNQSFFVNLSNPASATISDAQGVATIIDNDGVPPIPNPLADVAFDFGNTGLWGYYNNNGGMWSMLHNLNASLISGSQRVAGSLDGNSQGDLLANFPGFGLWARMNNASWVNVHTFDVTEVETGDIDGNGVQDIVVEFPGLGIWARLNGTTWVQLHTFDVSSLDIGDLDGNGMADVIVNFPGQGVWARINGVWSQLHAFDASNLHSADLDNNGQEDLLVNFAGLGIWRRMNNSGAGWSQLHGLNPTAIATGNIDGTGGMDVILNFTGAGVYSYRNNATWGQVHGLESSVLATADIDGNGFADVLLSFAGQGAWAFKNNATWQNLHNLNPDAMVGIRMDTTLRAGVTNQP